MGFEQLLGNARVKENLEQSLSRGRASHFYLISGPKGSGKHTLARLLAAALLCEGSSGPCGVCGPCRKVLNGSHPDFITADDPEKKTVPVALIRQIREDMFILPNEGKKKIYLFPRAQDMGLPGQNALLKVLEEPPGYGVFILLTDNPEKLLPTVRSRCVELALQPLERPTLEQALRQKHPVATPEAISAAISRSGGFLGQALELLEGEAEADPQTQALVEALCGRNALLLVQTLAPMEKWKREPLVDMLQQWTALLESALAVRAGLPALDDRAPRLAHSRSGSDLLQFLRALQKSTEYALGNVSPAAICGYLAWALR